jgi:hypothetical protein
MEKNFMNFVGLMEHMDIIRVVGNYGFLIIFLAMRNLLSSLDPTKLNSNTGEVVDAYWDAITSAWPKRRYHGD